MKGIPYLLSMLLFVSCGRLTDPHKEYDAESHVVDVAKRIKNIDISEKEISVFGTPYILNDYLIISDYKSPDKLIHIFDKNTFSYLTSVGEWGEGPGEIANMGSIVPDESDNTFYVIDYGRQRILSYPMDSVLQNALYRPIEKSAIDKVEFPSNFQYINDTLSYALFIRQLENGDYKPVAAKWNMKTGHKDFMDYAGHPQVERKRVSFSASVEHGLYVEAYWYHDLLSLCSLDGSLKYNLYGRRWNARTSNDNRYFRNVAFCGDRIVVSYLGDTRLSEQQRSIRVNYPTKLLVFDLEGNHLSTLETERPIITFCFDQGNNRLIMACEDERQFGYLDLDGLM